MPMSPRLLRPIASRLTLPTDADARAYVLAVNEADGQPLEATVVQAIDNFITGCKADGIWDAIKASCILAGARTLAGALVPLVGTAPTNNNFVSGDYDRKTGLVGNGTSKYLDTNRNNNADPQDSNHNAVFVSEGTSTAATAKVYIGSNGINVAGANNLFIFGNTGLVAGTSRTTSGDYVVGVGDQSGATGLIGHSRSSSSSVTLRIQGQNYSDSVTSTTPTNEDVLVYARTASSPALFNDVRMTFYSVGESLDLAALDTRVSALITAIGAAL